METVKIAIAKVSSDKNLKMLMELALLMGNYMNHSSVRGNARGFELESFAIVHDRSAHIVVDGDDKVR